MVMVVMVVVLLLQLSILVAQVVVERVSDW